MRVQSQQKKSRTMSELEEVKQDIKDARVALNRAEEKDDRDLILEREKRLNLLFVDKVSIRTGRFRRRFLLQ